MKPIRAWGLAVIAVLVAGAVQAANPPTTVYAKLFGPSKPKPGPAARTSNAAPRMAPVPDTLPPEMLANSLRAEQDAWERRMSVCLKLREVALETNDEELLKQVDELERKATSLYTARTQALGLPKVTPADEVADVKSAARKLVTPPENSPDTAVRTAEARSPKDIVREVKP